MDKEILDFTHEPVENDISPYLKHVVITLNDQATAGNYSSGQCVFETVSLSNNGKECDYREAYYTFPTVWVVIGTDSNYAVIDFTAANVQRVRYVISYEKLVYKI